MVDRATTLRPLREDSIAVPSSRAAASVLARGTLVALTAPRRLIPILIVVVPLLAEQSQSRNPWAIGVGLALCTACVVIAPVSFRVLAGERAEPLGVAAYAVVGAAVVLALGALFPWLLHAGPTFLTRPWSVAICLALYWIGGFGLARDIGLEESLVAQRRRADALAREAERAQLLALRAHLDPHFLFNTLNAIAEWCRLDGAVAEQAVLRLSDMLRAVLGGVRLEWWSLERELGLVDALFDLYKVRDPARFSMHRTVDPAALGARVPPLVLLPLAENAIKHGPAAGHAGDVSIAIAWSAKGLRIELSNPGPYRGRRSGSEGLPTVERRLALAYDGAARLEIGGDERRTTVVLELPKDES
jgi:signal transduction histidine kinase